MLEDLNISFLSTLVQTLIHSFNGYFISRWRCHVINGKKTRASPIELLNTLHNIPVARLINRITAQYV